MRNIRITLPLLLFIVAACGGPEPVSTTEAPSTTSGETTTTVPSTTTTTTSPPSTTSPPTTASSTTTDPAELEGGAVYFLLEELDPEAAGPYLVPVFRRVDASDPVAVVEALMAGPTTDEIEGTTSISTSIPEGVEVLGVEVTDGVATVDLTGAFDDGGGSFSMFSRLAQVTFTLTRLDSVEEVVFHLDGEPVTVFSSEGIELDGPQTREDYLDLLPPVFVDRPAWGQEVESPVEVRGLSNVFEAVSQVMLTDDDGEPLSEETVTASCGTGCWGDWEASIDYEIDREQFGALIVWTNSAEDGSRIHVREYPVQLR